MIYVGLMKRLIGKAKTVAHKSVDVIRNDGFGGFVKRATKYAYYRRFPERRKRHYRDILVINGCALPHPERYRVHHQIEQLRAGGMSADSIFYEQLDIDSLKYYRGFIFFRCPITDNIKLFIEKAKRSNKVCFFDIDDLVIDTKYTDQIQYVRSMNADEKALYDDGVNRMRSTLELCDYAITTTERLQKELGNYSKEVFINRNVASDEMVSLSLRATKVIGYDTSRIVIGYFSGSITHNEDFEMVMPSLVKLLEKYDNLYLKVVGILDMPETLKRFEDRIIKLSFMSWKDMPKEMASCDINIAPLVNSVFNEAKSENKWLEAALVKVVTAASDIGAFKKVIKHGKTGILVGDRDWFEALDGLITNRKRRIEIASAAHRAVLENHTTLGSSQHLVNFVNSKLARNIGFVIPSADISGGVNVVLKHAEILSRHGWDVTLIDDVHKRALKKSNKQYGYRTDIPGYNMVIGHQTQVDAFFDTMVATLWTTLNYVKNSGNTRNKLYFVQSYEADFYEPGMGEPRFLANATYNDHTGVRYITMSLWCKAWLKKRFHKDALYASNGIDLDNYRKRKRDFSGKIKILIEGDSRSEYKNTDEAFRIVEKLDPRSYEVSYLSYRREPKDWYRVDKFYNRIPPDQVGEVYANCDILVKTSLVESFSYPPLEMMATGGLSVVLPNGGNVEYLKDGVNCLFYEQGNVDDGVAKVELLVKDKALRDTLISNGLKTASAYSWGEREQDIIALYE